MSFSEKHYLGINAGGFHKIVYNDWGPEDAAPIVCVHGLTCNGHDFDPLAEHMSAKGYRLITVDLPGRARSDNLGNPMDYNLMQYNRDIVGLFSHLGVDEPNSIDFLGVSLGGLIGMCLAGVPNTPIRRLIINDVGPVIPQAALDVISDVVLKPRSFETLKDLEEDLRKNQRVGWGPIADEIWHHMAEHSARAQDDGSLTYNFDPDIAIAFNAQEASEVGLWPLWDNIQCPVMLVRGAKSIVLPEEISKEMTTRGPGPDMNLATFKDCGHAPSLTAPEHIKAIEKWLNDTQP